MTMRGRTVYRSRIGSPAGQTVAGSADVPDVCSISQPKMSSTFSLVCQVCAAGRQVIATGNNWLGRLTNGYSASNAEFLQQALAPGRSLCDAQATAHYLLLHGDRGGLHLGQRTSAFRFGRAEAANQLANVKFSSNHIAENGSQVQRTVIHTLNYPDIL